METTSDLILLEPLLQQLLASLLEHGPAQLQRLKLVELALVQEDAKILEKGRGLAGLGRDPLELPDGLCGPQHPLGQG